MINYVYYTGNELFMYICAFALFSYVINIMKAFQVSKYTTYNICCAGIYINGNDGFSGIDFSIHLFT